MTGRRCRTAALLGLLAALALTLQACREDEQGRILRFEPGTYRGEPDQALPQARIAELEERAHRQDF
jgi:hypothetical protein